MVIGFKPQFEDRIIAGTKKHTIREDKHDRWHAGMLMHMATGVRTKFYKCFKIDTCKSTQGIEIIRESDYLFDVIVTVDGRKMSIDEIQQLAWNDGFLTLIDFLLWFSEGVKGKIIHWTDLRY